jgi:hypothetical protein
VWWGEQSRDEMGSVTLELVPARQADRNTLSADLSERMKRITTTAFQQDPGLQERIRAISNGRSAVFQAGEPKR